MLAVSIWTLLHVCAFAPEALRTVSHVVRDNNGFTVCLRIFPLNIEQCLECTGAKALSQHQGSLSLHFVCHALVITRVFCNGKYGDPRQSARSPSMKRGFRASGHARTARLAVLGFGFCAVRCALLTLQIELPRASPLCRSTEDGRGSVPRRTAGGGCAAARLDVVRLRQPLKVGRGADAPPIRMATNTAGEGGR